MWRRLCNDFKVDAVLQVQKHCVAVVQAGRDFDVATDVLRRRVGGQLCPARGILWSWSATAELAEIAALKKDVATRKTECDVLPLDSLRCAGIDI